MFRSLRSTLLALVAALVVMAVGTIGLLLAEFSRTAARRWDFAALSAEVTALAIAVLVAVTVLSWILHARVTVPLRQLVAATTDIARGRFDRVTDVKPSRQNDEIGQLGRAFQDMAQRLSEVDARDRQFLMSISHELRTPLTAITGHAQALEDGLADDPITRTRSINVIVQEADRLERLVADIIDLARLRSNRFTTVGEHVWLDELGEHLMAVFSDLPDTAVDIEGNFERVALYSDGQRILQILRNLVGNGLRYAESKVTVTGAQVRGTIVVTVHNDGEPITADQRERIFEAFVGSKREGGMGLGLAIGRELAWALGGNLRCLDDPTGATFELALPLEPPGSGRY